MKISAIISGYYAVEYLYDRLANLYDQDPVPEVVMVSQRGSKEVKEFGSLVDVLVLTDGVPGLYEAWNLGIQASSGEFITNANADDQLLSGGLRVLADALLQGYDLAYGDYVKFPGGEQIRRPAYSLADIQEHCYMGPFPMWRRSLHDRFGWFDESLIVAGDWEFWIRCAGPDNFIHVDEVVGVYAYRPESLEHRNADKAAEERANIRAKLRP